MAHSYSQYIDQGPESVYCEDSFIGGAGPGPLMPPSIMHSTSTQAPANFGQRDWQPQWVPPLVLHVDSRERNRRLYQSANRFIVTMTHHPGMVRSIRLKQAIIPILRDGGVPVESYVAVCEKHCQGAIDQPELAGQIPNGVLAIIPLVPANVNLPDVAVFSAHTGNGETSWTANFFPPLPRLEQLDISLYMFGWNTGPPGEPVPALYPLADEPLPPDPADPVPAPLRENNVVLDFEVHYELRR